ncbi:MAG: hypothetical protein ACREK5_08940 [Gemmatimonadota bacterium]
MGEATSADDEVQRGVELEQKGLPDFQSPKAAPPARLPEIDLLEIGSPTQKLVPLVIGDGDSKIQVVAV